MRFFFIKFLKKLYYKQWIIGICRVSINELIETKKFDPQINWIAPKTLKKFYADPFLLPSKDQTIKILFEEFKLGEDYGNISLLILDDNFKKIKTKLLLSTKSHLSYPFIFQQEEKLYVFPEAAQSGTVSCYQYDSVNEELVHQKDLLNLPLLDSTIIKHNNKYWLFGTTGENTSRYDLYLFFSDTLLGSYIAHPQNPIKTGIDGIRSAGNFIEVNGQIYRPTQNCKKKYGDSISINKITKLNEEEFQEEAFMNISLKRLNRKDRVDCIHTINSSDNLIVLDAQQWVFSPYLQLRKIFKDHFKKG